MATSLNAKTRFNGSWCENVLVVVEDGLDPVRDGDKGASREALAQDELNQSVGVAVHLGRGLVQDQDAWFPQQRPRQTHQLSLPYAETMTPRSTHQHLFIRKNLAFL